MPRRVFLFHFLSPRRPDAATFSLRRDLDPPPPATAQKNGRRRRRSPAIHGDLWWWTAAASDREKLVVPFEMRGFQGIYNLEKKILEGAVRGLLQVQSPFPVRFPLPDPSDAFSLKPGTLVLCANGTQASKMNCTPKLAAAIAGARTAATQFSRNHENRDKGECKTNPITRENEHDLAGTSTSIVESAGPMEQEKCPQVRRTRSRTNLSSPADETMFGAERGRRSTRKVNPDYSDSSYKIFAAALRGLNS